MTPSIPFRFWEKKPGGNSRIITSDDVFDFMLNLRIYYDFFKKHEDEF